MQHSYHRLLRIVEPVVDVKRPEIRYLAFCRPCNWRAVQFVESENERLHQFRLHTKGL